MAISFDPDLDIETSTDNGKGSFWFTCAMVSTCAPLFDDCDDNYEVRAKLEAAGVINEEVEDDSESCQLWEYFQTQEAGARFVARLNSYLAEKARKVGEAARF